MAEERTQPERIVVRQSDLPKLLEVVGDGGERRLYQLNPAARKLGACLGEVPPLVRRMLPLSR